MNQELIDKLVDHYERCISMVEQTDDIWPIHAILRDWKTGYGICNCAKDFFGVNTFDDKWINSFLKNCNYWFPCPMYRYDKKDILLSLQLRLDRMKTYKESYLKLLFKKWFS